MYAGERCRAYTIVFERDGRRESVMRINERKKDGKRETCYKRVWLNGDGGNEEREREREKCVCVKRTRFIDETVGKKDREGEGEKERWRSPLSRERKMGYLRACATVRI